MVLSDLYELRKTPRKRCDSFSRYGGSVHYTGRDPVACYWHTDVTTRSKSGKEYVKTIDQLGDRKRLQQSELRIHGQNVERYLAAILDEESLPVCFAALLHDVGHVVLGHDRRTNGDPGDVFWPTHRLVNLVSRHSIAVDLDTQQVLEEYRSAGLEDLSLPKDEELDKMISSKVESVLADLSRRSAARGETTIVLDDRERFREEVCSEFLWALRLHPYDTGPVLKCLYGELQKFADEMPRKRFWGRISMSVGRQIELEIDPKALAFPELQDMPLEN